MTVAPSVSKAPSIGNASVPFSGGGGGGQSVSIPLRRGSSVSIIVPPGGFAGFAQQTAATQAMFQRAGRKGGKRSAAKRKRAKVASGTRTKRRKSAKRKRTARLVKGSAAAKRYMASIRKRRKRK